jgi:GalNAc-alpha-(1->4)-GalNAc-alpha-(1->3)-diNAcBac-PP-undecaprenol alpha-1,4-N-acetyl-D-galactosaminyltransferase
MLFSGDCETRNEEPMNILFLISSLGLGGAEKQLLSWTEILQGEFGDRVFVASFDKLGTQRLPALDTLDVPVVIAGHDQNTLTRVRRVVSFARRSQVDVVHAFSFYYSPIAIIAASTVNAVPVSSFQGDGMSELAFLSAPYRLLTLRRVRCFTSNSREAIARVKPHVPARTLLQYVPNLISPPDPTVHKARSPNIQRNLVVLAVARLDENKRIHIFLEALAAARRIEPRLTGVIVGDGPARDSLLRRASGLGLLPEGVKFLGQLLDPTDSYANADMFVHLAASEGTPNVVLEAMAMGLPVVTTTAGDLRLIIQPGKTGLVVPFDDAPAAAKCLVDLARSPELCDRLGEAGRVEILESFNSKRVRDSLDRLYSSMRR